jgi:uncharacterized protein
VSSKKGQDLRNDTVINVVALLKEDVGASRTYDMRLDEFPLDDDLVARNVAGALRLIRLQNELYLEATATATVQLECVRCLRRYDQSVKARFAAQYEPTVDVRTGVEVEEIDDEAERFPISENHEVDVAEPLRQELIVALPMRAVCGRDCPGPDLSGLDDTEDGDPRFGALADLLNDEPTAG